MGQPLVESSLLAILVAVLIGPFIAKKIELDFEGPRLFSAYSWPGGRSRLI